MAKITVIIPNYNGMKFLDPCMSALKKQTYTDFDVVIVDNGSTDGSKEYLSELEKKEQNVKVISLSENTGFTGAVNEGIKEADGEYAVLLNNDTEAESTYLSKMLEVFEEESHADGNKKLFAVSPKMLTLNDPTVLDDAGDGYNLFGWAFQRGTGQKADKKKFSKRTTVLSACAGAAMYKKEILEELKLPDGTYFDPLHFAYYEDIDISLRAGARGYRIVYEPGAVVKHVGSGTSGSKYNSFKVALAARNNVYVNYKNLPLLMLLADLPGILSGVVIKWLFFVKKGFGKDYAKGFIEGIKTLPEAGKKKTAFKISRTLNYIRLELMMLKDTFSYIEDVLVRHIRKRKS